MPSKKPLRYVVSSALLVGSLSACGASEHPVNEPRPAVNEPEHGPEINDPEPNEHPEHVGAEVETNEPAPAPEPEVSANEAPEEPTE